MYNVTLRPFCVTIAAVEKQLLHILCVCVCSLSYSAYKAHEPYYIIICVPHYLINGTMFGGGIY